jgi:Negative regulator of sigma F
MTMPADGLELSELQRELDACRKLVGQADGPADDLGPLEAEVTNLVTSETGTRATLRALVTGQRIGMLVAAVVVLGAITAAVTPRMDLASYPKGRMAAVLVLLAVLTTVATVRLLRPLHLPAPSLMSSRLLLLAGLVTPFVVSIVPLHDHVGGPAGEGMAFAIGCFKCLGFGGALGLPVLLLAFAMRRATVDGAAIAALAGVAAGLAGNVTLQLHCPIVDPLHLVIGHALLLVIFGTAAALWQPTTSR